MNFDFYQLYKEYSNTELLNIVKHPTGYQAAAVVVATQILNERQVTIDEIQSTEQSSHDIGNSTKTKNGQTGAFNSKTTDLFESVLHPNDKVEPNKWVSILLLAIGIQYAWTFYNAAKRLIGFLQCDHCSFDLSFLVDFLTLLYVPVVFFLLFKRRRWGWILLFADNLFSLISRVSQSYVFFKYQSIHHGDTTSFLLPILIKAAFVFFLWRTQMVSHFGITSETKKKTALITTAGTLLFIFIMYLMTGL